MNNFFTLICTLALIIFIALFNYRIEIKINELNSKLSTIQLQTSLQNWNADPMRVKSPNGLLMKKNNG